MPSRYRIPNAPVQVNVEGSIAANLNDRRGRLWGECLLQSRAQLASRLDDPVLQTVERSRLREVQTRGSGDVARVDVIILAVPCVCERAHSCWHIRCARHARPGDREEVEDAAAAVVDQHDRQLQAET